MTINDPRGGAVHRLAGNGALEFRALRTSVRTGHVHEVSIHDRMTTVFKWTLAAEMPAFFPALTGSKWRELIHTELVASCTFKSISCHITSLIAIAYRTL